MRECAEAGKGPGDVRWTCAHGCTRLLCTHVRDDPIELVQIRIEVKDCDISAPPSNMKGCTDSPFTATHSMISTYLGNITMVLKLPFTSAASTKGLHKYRGFGWPLGLGERLALPFPDCECESERDEGLGEGGCEYDALLGGRSEVAELGVGDLLGLLLLERVIERLVLHYRSW